MTVLVNNPSGIVNVGTGTLQASTSASAIAAVPNASTLSGDLVVLVAYVTGQDCTLASDLGDGWNIISRVYDSVNAFGAIAAVLNSRFNGSGTYAGISLPGLAGYTSVTASLRLRSINTTESNVWMLDASKATNGFEGITATASSATLSFPAISPSYGQNIRLACGGYNNGGTTTTIGVGFGTEIFDTGQTSPPHGIFLDCLVGFGSGNTDANRTDNLRFAAAGSATLAVAKTNRAGLTFMIPVAGNVTAGAARYRMSGGRRYG